MRPSLGLTALGATVLLLLGGIGFATGAQSTRPADSAMAAATAIFAGGCFWCLEADFEKQNEAERKIAEASRDALLKSGKLPQVLTQIAAASPFYPAKEYHQDYYRKNPIRYAYYRRSCGRDSRVQEIWGDR